MRDIYGLTNQQIVYRAAVRVAGGVLAAYVGIAVAGMVGGSVVAGVAVGIVVGVAVRLPGTGWRRQSPSGCSACMDPTSPGQRCCRAVAPGSSQAAPCSSRREYSGMGVQDVDASSACVFFLATFGLGLVVFGYGLAIRLGYYKRYFLVRGPAPLFGPANYHYGILLGSTLIILGLAGLPGDVETRQGLLGFFFIPSLILAFIVGFWQPWWLKPKWISQLKENHPDIYPFLREAAQEEVCTDQKKAEEWASKMDTVESQNEWVAEVRQRLGMPEPRTTEGTEAG
jgi:hypothetical protein